MSELRSTLNRAAASAGQTIRIEDRGPVGQVTLRGDLSSPALQAAVTAATGVQLLSSSAIPPAWASSDRAIRSPRSRARRRSISSFAARVANSEAVEL